ncbi:hypothetical protein SDJN03_18628, partial [Cucurbita argyrosperma subsp. sororia]
MRVQEKEGKGEDRDEAVRPTGKKNSSSLALPRSRVKSGEGSGSGQGVQEGSSVIVQEFTVITKKKGNLDSIAQVILVQRSLVRKQLLSLTLKGKKREEKRPSRCLSSIWWRRRKNQSINR